MKKAIGRVVAALIIGLCVVQPSLEAKAAGDPDTAVAVTGGSYHTCAIAGDQTLHCFGSDQYGQVSGPNGAGGTYTAIGAASYNTCAVTTAESLHCWGQDFSGEVSGPNADGGTYTQVVDGTGHTCALVTDQSIHCWGYDAYGETSGPNSAAGTYTSIAASYYDTCAAATDQTITCWGVDGNGQVTAANADSGTYLEVAVGGGHICGLATDGSIKCWGADNHGEASGPTAASGTYSSLVASGDVTCALDSAEKPHCWGDDSYGEVTGMNGWTGTLTALGIGDTTVCGISPDGLLHCWGPTGSDRLGAPPSVPSPRPSTATKGLTYSFALTNSAGLPPAPSGFTISAGALPPGIMLAADGTLSGTPTSVGRFTFTVSLANMEGSSSAQFTLQVIPQGTHLQVEKNYFLPNPLPVPLGTTVIWDYLSGTHHVVDATGMHLYNFGVRSAGDPSTWHHFYAAGCYGVEALGESFGTTVEVRMQATPLAGTPGTLFALTWAAHPAPKGFRYDVEIQLPHEPWRSWKHHVTHAHGSFVPSSSGTYQFRSRLVRLSNGAASAWSIYRTIKVS